MGIIKDKLHEQIENYNNVKYGDTIAVIDEFNHITNTANIHFNDPNSGIVHYAKNIAYKIQQGGMSTAAPTAGTKCWISFLSSNLLTPVITSLCDDYYHKNSYSKKTNTNSGAYISSYEVLHTDTSVETTPMINDYYVNIEKEEFEEYSNVDIIKRTQQQIMESDKYKSTENGVTDIITKSTFKIDEDGNINIFVSNNTGIKICPATGSIELYGQLRVNGVEINNTTNNIIIDTNNNSENVDNNTPEVNTPNTNKPSSNSTPNTNNNTNNNQININDILCINKIETIIQTTDTSELEEIIQLLVEINGENSNLNSLQQNIQEYKNIKEQFSKNNIDNIQETYKRIKYLSDLFITELKEAKEVILE